MTLPDFFVSFMFFLEVLRKNKYCLGKFHMFLNCCGNLEEANGQPTDAQPSAGSAPGPQPKTRRLEKRNKNVF